MKVLRPLDGLADRLEPPRSLPDFPQGRRVFAPLKGLPDYDSIFWPPPPWFRTSRTSDTEWMPYVAASIIFGIPVMGKIRQPPFLGGPPFWSYQKYIDGARDRATSADFFFYPSSKLARGMAIRIQTEQYHNFTTSQTYAFDRNQRSGVLRKYRITDLYDYDWLWDKSGRAIMYFMRRALAGIERQALPQTTRHARRSRSAN